MRLLRNEDGSVTVIAAFGMIALMGAMALALDVGQLRYQKNKLQRAADAAALAAVLEVGACAGVSSCAVMQQAASSAVVENGLTPTSIVTNCAAPPTSGITFVLNNPPCALGAADPNLGHAGYVEVIARQTQATIFGRFLGMNTVLLAARAEAAPGAVAPCIYALRTVGNATFAVDLNVLVTSTCGGQVLAPSSSAVDCELGGVFTVPSFKVAGGLSPSSCLIVPAATTNVPLAQIDPLGSLPTPTVPSCGSSNSSPYSGSNKAIEITSGSTATFYPTKAYCGGISIDEGATVTFQPGTYVITSNGSGSGLTLNVGASATGNGVTFYNYGPSGKVSFVQAVYPPSPTGLNLVAPKTGTYAGILFFQDVNDNDQATIYGSLNYHTVLEGFYYFPGAKVVLAYGGQGHYNGVVGYRVEFQALSLNGLNVITAFTSDYSQLPGGSPLANPNNAGGLRIP